MLLPFLTICFLTIQCITRRVKQPKGEKINFRNFFIEKNSKKDLGDVILYFDKDKNENIPQLKFNDKLWKVEDLLKELKVEIDHVVELKYYYERDYLRVYDFKNEFLIKLNDFTIPEEISSNFNFFLENSIPNVGSYYENEKNFKQNCKNGEYNAKTTTKEGCMIDSTPSCGFQKRVFMRGKSTNPSKPRVYDIYPQALQRAIFDKTNRHIQLTPTILKNDENNILTLTFGNDTEYDDFVKLFEEQTFPPDKVNSLEELKDNAQYQHYKIPIIDLIPYSFKNFEVDNTLQLARALTHTLVFFKISKGEEENYFSCHLHRSGLECALASKPDTIPGIVIISKFTEIKTKLNTIISFFEVLKPIYKKVFFEYNKNKEKDREKENLKSCTTFALTLILKLTGKNINEIKDHIEKDIKEKSVYISTKLEENKIKNDELYKNYLNEQEIMSKFKEKLPVRINYLPVKPEDIDKL